MAHISTAVFSVTGRARLRLPRGILQKIRRAEKAGRKIPREELSPAGVWLEDHARFLAEEGAALRQELAGGVSLPAAGGIPRILLLAKENCRQGEISPARLLRLIREKMGEEELNQAEVNALPQALRCALFAHLDDILSHCLQQARLYIRARREADQMSRGRIRQLPEDALLWEKMIAIFTAREDAHGLGMMDELLEKRGVKTANAARHAHEEMTLAGQMAGRVIQSLHTISHLPLAGLQERINPVAAVLRQEATYRQMDAESRGYYQRCAERLAKKYHVRESAVARAALALAEGKTGQEGECGYYLDRRGDLIAEYLLQKKGASFVYQHREGLFLASLYAFSGLSLPIAIFLRVPVFFWPAVVLCASQLVRQFAYAFLRRRFPERMLPRLRLKEIPGKMRTLVVVPTLLISRKQTLRMVRQLAVLRAANPEKHLDFMLLGDFADSGKETLPGDEEILMAGQEAIRALNRQGNGRFFYLHRARSWDEGQGKFTGRERKRGALEMLNHLLVDGNTQDHLLYASCDPALLKGRYAYVITLDADTFLPPGAARKLIGAMAHPLQKGKICIIQPRMETAADTVRTRTQRFLGGQGGVDPYQTGCQDIYQDVFGKGSFVGKGIYDPGLFLEKMEGRIPAGRLLSHDLIEGEISGSALAGDIVLYDGHPAKLSGWHKRLHRWTRGDWQLLPFLTDRRLSLLSRHKIWDNLRRSLLPAGQMMLLLGGALFNAPLLFLLGLPWPARGMARRLLLLPAQMLTQLDGAIRAVYRLYVSKRGLLSWITAAQAEGSGTPPLSGILSQVVAGSALILFSLLPQGFLPAVFLGMAWVVAPLFASWLDAPIRGEWGFTPGQKESVRALARDTWRFFADWVKEEYHFLPPDNVQMDPDKGPALRTSPTNIGLYLLSCGAARELGLITTAQMAKRMDDTLRTLEKMDTWHGHLYNWYDLKNASPLPPRFISTVDSGNLAGCLLACAQLCRRRLPEMEEDMRSLPGRLDAFAEKMDFSPLYDRQADLFYVGYDAKNHRPTAGHYDQLASEARLASFLAIARRQAPLRHWQCLNRSITRSGGGPALISWGGTLFEYLMPTLLTPLTPGTLLGESCMNAVRAQMGHHGRRPFGISESGYYAFDPDLNYQYRAFGLPGLALSGETAGQVIAPYASMLALPFFPRAAGQNLERMKNLGWLDGHGLFEAADYSPQRMEKIPRLVKSHMAHHQGMILCAACNALCDFALVQAFMAPPAMQAFSYLLQERAPKKIRRRMEFAPPREDDPDPGELNRSVREGLPVDAQALYGGGMTWVLSANGQGYLSRNGMMITRFYEEAGMQSGPQFYLRNEKTGEVFRPAADGRGYFEGGSAKFYLEKGNMRGMLHCCVAPLGGTAIATLTVENTGKEELEMEAISFLEIAQGNQAADRAHSNFRDLSVRVEPWGKNGLLSRRLPRDEKDQMPLIAHVAAGDFFALRRQGDRQLFLGRMGSYARPAQLMNRAEECDFRTGDVIAPCFSLRARMHIPAGKQAQIFFLTAVAEKPADFRYLPVEKEKLQGIFPLAATQARMTMRYLRMDGRMLFLYQRLLGALIFSGQPHQAANCAAAPNALWRLGVSGTLPVWLVKIKEQGDKALLRHCLRAHAFMRMQGVWTDLIFLCPGEAEYHRPLRDQLDQLIAASPSRDVLGVPGGLFIGSANEEEEQELKALARLALETGTPLRQQLSALPGEITEESMPLSLPVPIAPPALDQDNSFGGFTEEGDYWVYAPSPAPWHQLLCGKKFGTLVSENGILHSYAGNSRLGGITRVCPDVHRAPASEEIYLRTETGLYPLARCSAAYSPGAAVYRTLSGSVYADLSVFSHPEAGAGIRHLTLRSEKKQMIRLFYLVRFALGERGENTRCEKKDTFLFAKNGGVSGVAWAAMAGGEGMAVSPGSCFGLLGTEAPPGLLRPDSDGGSVGLFRLDLEILPHQPRDVFMALGFDADENQAKLQYENLRREGAGNLLRQVKAYWEKRLQGLMLFSSDRRLDAMLNRWLPYQVRVSRLLARMGPYQPGGAFGFRDQLQDMLALLYTEPQLVRAHILLCAAHQYVEGDVQHWWHPERKGVRTRISDDKLFLPYLTAAYIRVTGERDILSASVPYLVSAPLEERESERYEEPEESAFRENLLSHCLRAIDSVGLGSHDLPLMGGGDWNDGMNRIGGKNGESVWLGFFLALVLREFAPLCPGEIKGRLDQMRRRVMEGCENAWTGKWYLRAYHDSGEPIGGPDTEPERIDLISQCFAALAGAPREQCRIALFHALDLLYDRENGLVKLLSPPFTPEENAGYIGGYLPGVRENGGQYTHAVPWLVMALCKMGEYALAWEIARAILPFNHGNTREKALIYRAEPYVLAGDVYAGENPGRGGWSWYTGSAAWLYHVFFTVLLGFEKQGDQARLSPCPEPGMEEYTLIYRFGSASYHFTAARDIPFPTLDGEKIRDGWVKMASDGRTHEARFPLREN